jgi:riboflavin kinase/FMN adenylyltransferase
MKVYNSTEGLPVFNRAVITIGTFDGVHLGHRQILEQLKKEAASIVGETVIITFHPHPRKVVPGQPSVQLINTIEEKIELIEQNGIDHLVIVPFTTSFREMKPEEYIENFLIRTFHPHTIIIGYDHRFGKDRAGDYRLLEQYSERLGYKLKEIPAHVINENTVSSTLIREALLRGEISSANAALGYEFFFEGTVVDGDKLGRKLGYPTANLKIESEEKIVPGDGVYAVFVEVRRRKSEVGNQKSEIRIQTSVLKGMMSIGVRPTIGGTRRIIEVNIFDFDQQIYGTTLRVYVKKYLRGQIKFNSLDALKEQMGKDKEDTLASF